MTAGNKSRVCYVTKDTGKRGSHCTCRISKLKRTVTPARLYLVGRRYYKCMKITAANCTDTCCNLGKAQVFGRRVIPADSKLSIIICTAGMKCTVYSTNSRMQRAESNFSYVCHNLRWRHNNVFMVKSALSGCILTP
jgi:hypothetical protein